MCGRFTQTATSKELLALLDGLEIDLSTLLPDYNVAPAQDIVTIMNHPKPLAVSTVWGIPSARGKGIHINARSETIHEKPAFHEAFRTRRCLIPAGGFYEWQHRGREVSPWFFRLAGVETFCLAGIWQAVGGRNYSAILTTEANGLLRAVHDRMPVILARQHYRTWLEDGANPAFRRWLLTPYPASEMTGYPVSNRVNMFHIKDASCIQPQAEERLLV